MTRQGLDKTHSRNRDTTPFVVRVELTDGEVREYQAAGVIDASGTWSARNPLGTSGLPALGEAASADRISSPLPDVLGRDRETFAGRRAVVVGAGHSAANTLINLSELAAQVPGTKIVWAIRGASAAKVYGGGDADGLAARGQLGGRLRALVENGTVELHTGFGIAALAGPMAPPPCPPPTAAPSKPTSWSLPLVSAPTSASSGNSGSNWTRAWKPRVSSPR